MFVAVRNVQVVDEGDAPLVLGRAVVAAGSLLELAENLVLFETAQIYGQNSA